MECAAYTGVEDIKRLNSRAEALFDWCPIPLGSPIRVHAYSYRNWGIVVSAKNIDWIYHASKAAYSAEWRETDAGMNTLIAEACEKAGLLDSNAVMNARIAAYASEHIVRLAGGAGRPFLFRIKDIGAGAGCTSRALVSALLKAGLGPEAAIELVLIEPSQKRLETALGTLSMLLSGSALERSIHITPHAGSVDALSHMDSDSTDMFITNAAIHHESFNGHLQEIFRVLRAGAPLISGDWHEGTYESPARVYWMYFILQEPHDEKTAKALFHFVRGGALARQRPERPELAEFRKLYGLDTESVNRAFDGLTTSERCAVVGSMRYWLEMAKRFGDEGKRSPEVLLQCHERVSKRLEALKDAGFAFDTECRSKYVELLRRKGFGELTAVMMAKKAARQARPLAAGP